MNSDLVPSAVYMSTQTGVESKYRLQFSNRLTPPYSPEAYQEISPPPSVSSNSDVGSFTTGSNVISTKLTDTEVKFLRHQRQMIKNRESALKSRARKKEHTDRLEQQVVALQAEINRLQTENAELRGLLAQQKEPPNAPPSDGVRHSPLPLRVQASPSTISIRSPTGSRVMRVDKRLVPFFTLSLIMVFGQHDYRVVQQSELGLSHASTLMPTDWSKSSPVPGHHISRRSVEDTLLQNLSSVNTLVVKTDCVLPNSSDVYTNDSAMHSPWHLNVSTDVSNKLHDLFHLSISDKDVLPNVALPGPDLAYSSHGQSSTALSRHRRRPNVEYGQRDKFGRRRRDLHLQREFDRKLLPFLRAINYDNSSFYVISFNSPTPFENERDRLLLLKGSSNDSWYLTNAPHKLSLLLPNRADGNHSTSNALMSMMQIDCVVTNAQSHDIDTSLLSELHDGQHQML